VAIQHDEVNLATPATEISCYWAKAAGDEKTKRLLLGALA
jgi:hypothetical protein